MNKTILCAWIGGTDWEIVEGKAGKDDLGPILRTLADEDWMDVDEIHLLNNYEAPRTSEMFKKHLSKKTRAKVVIQDVELSSPTNFEEVDAAGRKLVDSLARTDRLLFLVSPGTYTMQTIWVLIAHNHRTATLIEASKEAGVKKVAVPFTISVSDPKARRDKIREEITQGLRGENSSFKEIEYECSAMRSAVETAYSLAASSISILIEGEPGTGRTSLAQSIHTESKRKSLKSVNCSAHTDAELEVKLFGSVDENARRGEARSTRGLLRKDQKETLYLQEIDCLTPYLQTRLLHELSEIQQSSASDSRARLIFSSSTPLGTAVSKGHFRRDLFYMISQEIIWLPPLRDRGLKDLEKVTERILARLKTRLSAGSLEIQNKRLDPSAYQALAAHSFEGNVRELESVLTRSLIHSDHDALTAADIESALRLTKEAASPDDILNRPLDDNFVLDEVLDEVRRHYFARAKTSTPSLRQAAKALGFKHYQTLANRIQILEGFDW